MKVPGIFHTRSVLHAFGFDYRKAIHAPPSRVTGQHYFGKRWVAAWYVLTGQADALVWEGSPLAEKRWGKGF